MWLLKLLCNIIGYGIILWGVHKIDYIYGSNMLTFGRCFLTTSLQTALAIGILFVFIYKKIKKSVPNKELANKRLSKAIQHARLKNHMIGVLVLDFDRFKNINDALGHAVGDESLRIISKRLKSLVGSSGSVIHLNGDDFIILLPEIHAKNMVEEIAKRIITDFEKPILLSKHELYTTVSVGISVFPIDGSDESTLLKNAEIAMHSAKASGRDNYQVYQNEMKNDIYDNFYLENSLRSALIRKELQIYYQPKIDLKTGKISGVEALIRWMHPVLGLISPGDFIPIAEETGLIIPIGQWVLHTACLQVKSWQANGYDRIRVAVNVSAKQLQQEDFYQTVIDVLNNIGLEPSYLELEITESIVIKNIVEVNVTLNMLRRLGVNISLDDFGTGYATLSCLHEIDLDILKIDQSFIKNMSTNLHTREITAAIIQMAHNLNIKVTAEGVEKEEHVDFLKEQKCDYIQGYYFSSPLPVGEIELLFKRDKLLS
jgi:diguanylate cyclase (GGDEF)-like protein